MCFIGLRYRTNRLSGKMSFIGLLDILEEKGFSSNILKIVIPETVYGIWMYRNAIVFGTNTIDDTKLVVRKIIDTIIFIFLLGWCWIV